MPRQIELEFESGQIFRADLLEEGAPETCRLVWEALPIEVRVGHSFWYGCALNVRLSVKLDKIENPYVLGMDRGDILLNTNPNKLTVNDSWVVPPDVFIVYGPARFFDFSGWVPCNRFARIVEGDLGKLGAIGTQLRERGVQTLKIRRV